MPLQGFDDASKNISKRGSARRKAAREANSKRIAERQASREAKKAKKKADQADFNKYATPVEKRKSARNSSVNKADVVAKGKAAEQAKKPATTQESLLNIKNEYVGFNPFKDANKGGNTTETVTPKAKTVKAKAKPATESKATVAKTKSKGYQRSTTNTGFTSAADRIKSKGVSNLKPTSSKTENVAPKAEEKAYQKKGTMGKGKAPRINAKPKKRVAKGSRAATLKKGFGY